MIGHEVMDTLKAFVNACLARLGLKLARTAGIEELTRPVQKQEQESNEVRSELLQVRALLNEQKRENDAQRVEILQIRARLETLGLGHSNATPDNQAIADILRGKWYSEFPEQYRVHTNGKVRHFDFAVDARVQWAADRLVGGLAGKKILELGPFEAYNTWQMEELGADSIIAVEANQLNYLKCLLVKEITGLKARFYAGDFIKYLEASSEQFDVIWASGVLYHLVEPVRFLHLVSRRTDRVYIWTHYYDEAQIAANVQVRGFFDRTKDAPEEVSGFRAQRHYRTYKEVKGAVYASGSDEYAYWLEKDTLFDCLRHFGFTRIIPGRDDPNAANGPAMWFLAEKPS